jgi:hypothetical protein
LISKHLPPLISLFQKKDTGSQANIVKDERTTVIGAMKNIVPYAV